MIKKPNFIIAGFPKSGTTSLFAYLSKHPEIYIPHRKEMNYFSNPIIRELTGGGKGDIVVENSQINNWEDYLNYYKNVNNEKAIGDASPSYINFPSCFKEIKSKLGDPKIIVLLRDPVKRTYSNYLHLFRTGREKLSFSLAIKEEENRIKKRFSPMWYYRKHSLYYDKLLQAKRTFSNVLILTQEELKNNTKISLKKVFTFLEVDSSFIPSNLNINYNTGGAYKKNVLTNFVLKQSKLKLFLLQRFAVIKILKPFKDFILKKNKISPPELDKATETFLINYFKEDVNKVRTLGADLKYWDMRYFEA